MNPHAHPPHFSPHLAGSHLPAPHPSPCRPHLPPHVSGCTGHIAALPVASTLCGVAFAGAVVALSIGVRLRTIRRARLIFALTGLVLAGRHAGLRLVPGQFATVRRTAATNSVAIPLPQ